MPNKITKAQESAIRHHKGACLVLAGPGSGKTFVITKRLVHMVQELSIPGEHILVITFTKAAAMEMEARFKNCLPDVQPWFGTFHSCFYYILRNSYTSIPTRFISTEEKQHLLREICDEVLGKDFDIELDDIERVLSLYMNNGLSMRNMSEYADLTQEQLKQLYHGYHTALAGYGYMDFDDLMLCCYQLLKDNPEVRRCWQEQFQYILIDECQDMNVLQYEIVKLLTGPERNVFMVGDDDQSVYRFRGARVELMQRFIEEFKPVCQIQLDKNFRSTAEIVDSSLKVISQNKNRFVKNMVPAGPNADSPTRNSREAGSTKAILLGNEANSATERKCAADASGAQKEGVCIESFILRRDMYEHVFESLQKVDISSLPDCAIIYRTNRELRNMAYKLRRKGIPYYAGEDRKSIFDEEWYLDIEAYIWLGLGSLDRRYILRVANKPNRFIRREQLVNISRLPESLAQCVKHIRTMRPFLAMQYIWSGIGYGRWLERNLGLDTEQFDAVEEQFKEITQEMKEFASLEDWLTHVEEDRRRQKENQKPTEQSRKNGVQLMTMHASKGLEFDTVYLLDVNKGKIPKGSKLSEEELEEERRLFYVALTRAKQHLNIYYVKGEKDHALKPSVFLEPIL